MVLVVLMTDGWFLYVHIFVAHLFCLLPPPKLTVAIFAWFTITATSYSGHFHPQLPLSHTTSTHSSLCHTPLPCTAPSTLPSSTHHCGSFLFLFLFLFLHHTAKSPLLQNLPTFPAGPLLFCLSHCEGNKTLDTILGALDESFLFIS